MSSVDDSVILGDVILGDVILGDVILGDIDRDRGRPITEDPRVPVLTGSPRVQSPPFSIGPVADRAAEQEYLAIRREVFVAEQGLFAGHDRDDIDDDPRRIVLIARDRAGHALGGVRLAPATTPDLGWWNGSRLAVRPAARVVGGVGEALVRAAGAHAHARGALRFEACVQSQNEQAFRRWGWVTLSRRDLHGRPHVTMRLPIDRIQQLARATKAALADLLEPLREARNGLGAAGFVGDDGTPIAGTDVVAACDAIVPSMVERTPEWAGWCAVLVNINDLAAMGAAPTALLDAVAARDASFARRILAGLRDGAAAWGVPVVGGHTQLGVPAALSVTALGRTTRPVPAGGGRPGHALTVTADLGGGWRPGYSGAQWDSTSTRSPAELRDMAGFVARTAPAAAKDVSMAGLVGTAGMLAEASGTGAVIDVATVPRPGAVSVGDWFTCFPGFAMITAADPGIPVAPAGPAESAVCGVLTGTPGVRLRWPDGEQTLAITGPVTGLGAA